MKIDNDVLDVLSRSTTEDNVLYLPSVQLERNLYVKVNKCLEMIGGQWNRKAKGHIFDNSPDDLLDEMINTGEVVDKKKEYQFFETPEEIVLKMIKLAEIKPDDILLEPEAGKGAILRHFPKENKCVAVELLHENAEYLVAAGYNPVLEMDFLSYIFKADVIVMNPPFNKQQDVDHILHAWECLYSGGRLVAIVSESPFFRENKKSQEFRNFLRYNDAEIINLNDGAFKNSGTMVKTRIIKLVKP